MIESARKDWASSVIPWVDECIEQLVRDFMSHPYMHRVEHSLHIQLYNLLLRDERLQRPHLIGTSAFKTGLLHKEWPGQTAIVDPRTGRGRRQSYDLAILDPASVKAHTLENFSRGTYEAPIVIELGLDYSLGHLEGDLSKFDVNQVPYPYVVHFSRKRTRLAGQVEQAILNAPDRVRSVFVHLDPDQHAYRYKSLDSKSIECAPYVHS